VAHKAECRDGAEAGKNAAARHPFFSDLGEWRIAAFI
jgi:hypothetical protein